MAKEPRQRTLVGHGKIFLFRFKSLSQSAIGKLCCREVTGSHFETKLERCPRELSEALDKDRIRGESLEPSLEDEPPREADKGRSDM